MKNATKLSLAVLLGLSVMPALPSFAQGTANATVSSETPGTALPSAGSIQLPAMDTFPTPLPVASAPALPTKTLPMPSLRGEKEEGDGKIPASVKSAMTRLNAADDDSSMAELNTARAAMARLDVLIDIEKRLKDLETVRRDREEKSMAGAIPASALRGYMPPPVAPPPMPIMPMRPIEPPQASVEVTRVIGAAGRYVAYVKVSDGKTQRIRQGEKLSDGSLVQDISSQGVSLLRDKKTRFVRIKDLGTVFGGR